MIGSHYEVYFFGDWGSGYYARLPFSGKSAYLIKKILTYTAFLAFIVNFKLNYRHLLDRFVVLFLLYLAVTACFGQLSDRFEPLALYFMFSLVVVKWNGKLKGTFTEWFLILVIIIRFLLDFWGYRIQYLDLATSFL
ncbi:hypothetical protein VEZ01S_19_00670 [Vibrio ezurae NBRC 102218]|uniref:Uncharacterized protein n=1 Tax=Vibrio ezurae NBRC 102218 TaxID=1219080 RepID=U3B2H7_9VIBR|nr:hypothetical protein VEZ01S_19_00670 [Vibrio ezurae NBRC 102218]